MANSRVSEYQIRTACEDGTEELTGWMGSEERLAQAMAALRPAQRTTYWLQVRSVVCSDCCDKEIIVESPITGIPSPRYRPHNSDYLVALGSRSRYELFEASFGFRR